MKLPVREQMSAGGVVFRREQGPVEIAIICVGNQQRWQLPKGLVEAGEKPEYAAIREVREEAGIEGELLAPIETIEYWYVASKHNGRVRFHKFVHFFLLHYKTGDIGAHDDEVIEARWVSFDNAREMLAFNNERRVVARADVMIAAM